jgi:hypothetical protein
MVAALALLSTVGIALMAVKPADAEGVYKKTCINLHREES